MSPPAAARSSCHRSAGRPLWLSHPWHALSATRDRMPTMHGSPALRGLACRGAPVHEPVPRDQPPSALRTVLGGPCLSAIPAPHGRSRAWLPPGCRMAAWALLRKAQLVCIGVDLQRRVVRNNQNHTGPAAQGPAAAGRSQQPGPHRAGSPGTCIGGSSATARNRQARSGGAADAAGQRRRGGPRPRRRTTGDGPAGDASATNGPTGDVPARSGPAGPGPGTTRRAVAGVSSGALAALRAASVPRRAQIGDTTQMQPRTASTARRGRTPSGPRGSSED